LFADPFEVLVFGVSYLVMGETPNTKTPKHP